MSAGAGFSLILIGSIAMINSANDYVTWMAATGTLLLTLGGVFVGVMASINLSGQSTQEITKNVIDVLKHEGLIASDSQIRINENLEVVKPVSSTLTVKYNIEKPYWKTAI